MDLLQEGKTGSVDLSEDRPEIIKHVLESLYSSYACSDTSMELDDCFICWRKDCRSRGPEELSVTVSNDNSGSAQASVSRVSIGQDTLCPGLRSGLSNQMLHAQVYVCADRLNLKRVKEAAGHQFVHSFDYDNVWSPQSAPVVDYVLKNTSATTTAFAFIC